MAHILSREQVRQVDRIAIEKFGMCGLVLMENAARGVVDALVQRYPQSPVTILCGKGNNAGDGYAIARHLDNRHWPVTIVQLLPENELAGDALANWKIAQAAKLRTIRLANCSTDQLRQWLQQDIPSDSIVLDCMLGTGAVGEPRFPFDVAVDTVNRMEFHRVAVDIPTGLDCDSGQPAKVCFQAELTCTFVAAKPGFQQPEALTYLGSVEVIDIGVPRSIMADWH